MIMFSRGYFLSYFNQCSVKLNCKLEVIAGKNYQNNYDLFCSNDEAFLKKFDLVVTSFFYCIFDFLISFLVFCVVFSSFFFFCISSSLFFRFLCFSFSSPLFFSFLLRLLFCFPFSLSASPHSNRSTTHNTDDDDQGAATSSTGGGFREQPNDRRDENRLNAAGDAPKQEQNGHPEEQRGTKQTVKLNNIRIVDILCFFNKPTCVSDIQC